MTRTEIITLVTNMLARPNDTYVSSVLPSRLDQSLNEIERFWDWGFQYEEYDYTVAIGANEIPYTTSDKVIKKISNGLFNTTDNHAIKFKRFYNLQVSETGSPRWYTFTPAGKLYLSSRVEWSTDLTIPLRNRTTSTATHPLYTEYPQVVADYTHMLCKKDFIAGEYTMDLWLKDRQAMHQEVVQMNNAEKAKRSALIELQFGIKRYEWLTVEDYYGI